MFEVELKVRHEHEPIRGELADRDVSIGPPQGQTDIYFNAPHRDFARTDEALRLRRETALESVRDRDIETVVKEATAGAPATLTYKGPRIDDTSKTRAERETEVTDGDTIESVLEQLGFEAVATVRKVRETAHLEEYTLALDRVAGLGEFVEIERTVEEDDIDAARAGARDWLRDLGLDPDAGIKTSYLELLLES